MQILQTLKPEERAEVIVYDWLKQGTTIINIYFNRKNILNAPVFNIKGECREKPDFVIAFNRGFGVEYMAVEIKAFTCSKNMHDSGKILLYYENYITGKTKYFINEEEIMIKHFSVANNLSPKGYLFPDGEVMCLNSSSSDKWRSMNAEYGYIPEYEYERTSDFIRGRLWSGWRDTKKRLKVKESLPSIGILISNPTKDTLPYFFTMIYVDWINNKKSSWRQRFFKL